MEQPKSLQDKGLPVSFRELTPIGQGASLLESLLGVSDFDLDGALGAAACALAAHLLRRFLKDGHTPETLAKLVGCLATLAGIRRELVPVETQTGDRIAQRVAVPEAFRLAVREVYGVNLTHQPRQPAWEEPSTDCDMCGYADLAAIER